LAKWGTVSCCSILSSILAYAAASKRTVPGLQVGHLFDTAGAHSESPIVYVLPARGRGVSKVAGLVAIMTACPFCGKKQPRRPVDGE
jgi:hypothetical protein